VLFDGSVLDGVDDELPAKGGVEDVDFDVLANAEPQVVRAIAHIDDDILKDVDVSEQLAWDDGYPAMQGGHGLGLNRLGELLNVYGRGFSYYFCPSSSCRCEPYAVVK